MSRPWNDWIPGVLRKSQVLELCKLGLLDRSRPDAAGLSSIDIHLSSECYELTNGSVKPFGETYLNQVQQSRLTRPLLPDVNGHFILEPKKTYLFKARERLYASILRDSPIHGQATAKSSIGRLDVLARLIVDGMDSYEEFTPQGVGKGNGDIFLEITPLTFSVVAKEGVAVSQLRFFCGHPSDSEVRGEAVYRTLLKDASRDDGTLSVDLSNVQLADGQLAAALRAKDFKDGPSAPIRLWKEPGQPRPNPMEYWDAERADGEGEHSRLTIKRGAFYILRSKEKIAVPKGIAVYCRAIDETIGEIRIHYAGFVHPFFGRERSDGKVGTPLIFEVRGHDIDVNLKDGEKMARLTFYRMSEDAEHEQGKVGDYKEQTLKLSNLFAEWPSSSPAGSRVGSSSAENDKEAA